MVARKFKLISRSKTNYSISNLLKSFFVKENTSYENSLKQFLSNLYSNKNILLTSSGRGALYVILKSLQQTKVIIPSYTCSVVTEAALLAGKQCVYVPVDKETYNMRTENLRSRIDSDSIVIATHQYGLPCDIVAIKQECEEKNAVLVEDCAAAFNSEYQGAKCGIFGEYAFFSFDSSKFLTVPSKGGFIICKDKETFEKLQDNIPVKHDIFKFKFKHLTRGLIYLILENPYLYRMFHYLTMGRKNKRHMSEDHSPKSSLGEFYLHPFYNWQAYIIMSQINKIKQIFDRRQTVFKMYKDGIENSEFVQKPVYSSEASYIRYGLLVKDRDYFYSKCLENGVDLSFSFDYNLCKDESADYISSQIVNLPFYYKIKDYEVKYIIDTINKISSDYKQIKKNI